jgi:hypothetical protein
MRKFIVAAAIYAAMSTANAYTILAVATLEQGDRVILLADDCIVSGMQYLIISPDGYMVGAGCWAKHAGAIYGRGNNNVSYRWSSGIFKVKGE